MKSKMTVRNRSGLKALVGTIAAGSLLISACGGSDEAGDGATQTPKPQPATSAATDGKAVFEQNCASCHTLAAAGSNGAVGPNLDQAMPSEATVLATVTNGGGGMPAFEGVLSSAEIAAVSKYVADSAGK